jgi:hypothetical protein
MLSASKYSITNAGNNHNACSTSKLEKKTSIYLPTAETFEKKHTPMLVAYR